MKFKFCATFMWAGGTAQWDEPFEAGSTDEVIARLDDMIVHDSDGSNSERFTLESKWNDENDIDDAIDYVYEVRLRRNTLIDEKEKMYKELRPLLNKLFSK